MDNSKWTYEENNPGYAEDGYFLLSPDDREVGLINNEIDAMMLCEMINEALMARRLKAELGEL